MLDVHTREHGYTEIYTPFDHAVRLQGFEPAKSLPEVATEHDCTGCPAPAALRVKCRSSESVKHQVDDHAGYGHV